MNNELICAIEALEKENGINKEIMFDTIEKALFEEYKAQYKRTDNCRVSLDRGTGEFHIYSDRLVVEDDDLFFEDDGSMISISDAKKIQPNVNLGDTITIDLPTDGFTRTASKAAKNAIIQKIREAEKEALFNEYKQKEGTIITGIVQRIDEKGNILVDIGKVQTDLRADEQVKGEVYNRGDRIKVVVSEVSIKEKRGTTIKISRSSPLLVKALFEEGVAEIQDGIVEIKSIAREAGSRTKMAVKTNDESVDPVGACVGRNGERVRMIVSELGNEQIDIIDWDENPAQLIVNALSPAKVVSVIADEYEKQAFLVVSDQQLSLAIGKSGQNVRLAAKLTNYGIDIKSESQMEAEEKKEVLVMEEEQNEE